MTAKDLEKFRDDLVKVPGVEKDITMALYNIGIAIVERLDKIPSIPKLDGESIFDMVFGPRK